MSPERIHLFFTNFTLVSISQINANSIAIFRHNATLSTTLSTMLTFPPFYRLLCDVTSRSTNQLHWWPYKNHDIHFRILF